MTRIYARKHTPEAAEAAVAEWLRIVRDHVLPYADFGLRVNVDHHAMG